MRTYATTEQLAASPGGDKVAPEHAEHRLRLASKMVDDLLRGRVYPTDATGHPTDPDHVLAVADAVCAIAVELDATDATAAGGTLQWESVSIGSVSLSGRAVAPGTVTALGLPVPAVALVHLSDVGTVQVSSGGSGYVRPLHRVAR